MNNQESSDGFVQPHGLQNIFNHVVLHARKQGKKAMDSRYVPMTGETQTICRYLDSNGCQCFAGCLIPPKDYNPSFEGAGLNSPGPAQDYFHKHFDDKEFQLIALLQNIHDHSDVNEWEEEFAYEAKNRGLTVPA